MCIKDGTSFSLLIAWGLVGQTGSLRRKSLERSSWPREMAQCTKVLLYKTEDPEKP